MALKIKNLTGSDVAVNDLGLTVKAGGTYDLSTQDKPSQVVRSAQADGDLYANIITSANLAVLDPLDDVTQLNAATSIEILQRHNDSHYRIQGGELNQLDDVTITTPSDTQILTYSGGQWINTAAPTPGDPDQNLWETIAGDTGSTTANTTTDTLTIAGGTGISTAVVGDTITITSTVVNTDEKVKVSANDTTADYLENKVVGTADQITVTTLNDGGNEDLQIKIADNVILPGSEGMLAPSGTTAERPSGSPITEGTLRFNETLSVYEYYANGEWVSVANSGNAAGSILGYHFLWGGTVENAWVGTTSNHILSNEVPYVMPFACKIVGLGFSNIEELCATDLEVYKGVKTGASAPFTWTSTRILTAQIRTKRIAYVSNLNIALNAGDVLGCYFRKLATGAVKADRPVVSLYIQVTAEYTPQSYTAYQTVASNQAGGILVAAAAAETNPAKIIGP